MFISFISLFIFLLNGDSVFCSAITNGISHLVGQVAVGTLADLVLWKPENFGAKPEMVLKSGVIAWSQVRKAIFCLTDPKIIIDVTDISLLYIYPLLHRLEMPTLLFQPSNRFIRNPCGVPNRDQQCSIQLLSYHNYQFLRKPLQNTDYQNEWRLYADVGR